MRSGKPKSEAPPSLQKMKRTIPVVTLLLVTAALQAENWPQFRGPTGQGTSTETGLPLRWTATENVAWRTAIPGESRSSPIVWDDRVFVTTAAEGGVSCRVLSLDRMTGSVLWKKEVFQQLPRRKEGRNTAATPTSATDGARVYACFGDGSFAALNFAGEDAWTNRNYPFYSQHGLATSPILHRGLLIMARDGSSEGEDKSLGWHKPWDQSFILALDAQTGKERWKARRGWSRISHGVPAPFGFSAKRSSRSGRAKSNSLHSSLLANYPVEALYAGRGEVSEIGSLADDCYSSIGLPPVCAPHSLKKLDVVSFPNCCRPT